MAKLHVSEYGGLVQTSGGVSPLVAEPPTAEQVVSYTTSTQSSAFNANTKVIRLVADADAYIKVGADPTADANDKFLPSGVVEYFYVQPGDKIAAYDGTS